MEFVDHENFKEFFKYRLHIVRYMSKTTLIMTCNVLQITSIKTCNVTQINLTLIPCSVVVSSLNQRGVLQSNQLGVLQRNQLGALPRNQ